MTPRNNLPAVMMIIGLCATPCVAQRADDNAITAADDAFGSTIGDETIGLYSSKLVRGFSPLTAGNVRIDGLYFDRQGAISQRLSSSSTIRVGLSAQSYPFPAPTGIVDYQLQLPEDKRVVSVLGALNAYEAPTLEVDAKLPLIDGKLGVAVGVSYAKEEYYDGADAIYQEVAITPRWRPTEHVEVIPFWSRSRGRDEEVAPTIVTNDNFLPPEIDRRYHFGQQWADNETANSNHGLITRIAISENWLFSSGVFRSVQDLPEGYADIFYTDRDGMAVEQIVADPRQRYASTSGELRLSHAVIENTRAHLLNAIVRGRDQTSIYGGSAEPLVVALRPLGQRMPVASPELQFDERTRDDVGQWTTGLAYEGRWRDVGEASFGVQRSWYRKRIEQPDLAPTNTRDDPWLFNATVAAYLTDAIAAYVGYTRGLEESGIAPDDAANRNQAMPAIRTRQRDAGVRWKLASGLKLVTGYFDVEKPYFATDENNIYSTLGEVRHRGIELSLNGALSSSWSMVAGAVWMDPEVHGEAVRLGRVGDKPVGQTHKLFKANVDYRPQALSSLSFDVAATHVGDRIASGDSINEVPAYTLIDFGARYRFQIYNSPATLRAQIANVTDEFSWNIYGNNSFGLMDERRYMVQLVVDL